MNQFACFMYCLGRTNVYLLAWRKRRPTRIWSSHRIWLTHSFNEHLLHCRQLTKHIKLSFTFRAFDYTIVADNRSFELGLHTIQYNVLGTYVVWNNHSRWVSDYCTRLGAVVFNSQIVVGSSELHVTCHMSVSYVLVLTEPVIINDENALQCKDETWKQKKFVPIFVCTERS